MVTAIDFGSLQASRRVKSMAACFRLFVPSIFALQVRKEADAQHRAETGADVR